MPSPLLSGLHLVAAARRSHGSAANTQLFVCLQELHTLEVTSQETVAQVKAHVASLEGIALEDQAVLLMGTPLEDEGV